MTIRFLDLIDTCHWNMSYTRQFNDPSIYLFLHSTALSFSFFGCGTIFNCNPCLRSEFLTPSQEYLLLKTDSAAINCDNYKINRSLPARHRTGGNRTACCIHNPWRRRSGSRREDFCFFWFMTTLPPQLQADGKNMCFIGSPSSISRVIIDCLK